MAIVALRPHIDILFLESLEDKRIIVANATDTITKETIRIVGVYISPQFEESKFQWEALDKINITNNTVVAGDFNAWPNKLCNTYPTQSKPHHKGATMLHYMTQKELIFTLDDKEDGPASLTRWVFDVDNTPVKGSRLDYILVAGALAHISSRLVVITSLVSNHMIVVVKIAKPERKN
ncbi:hypothetical protein DSO57_1033198 [Entomophthora muscae]|uniref:Uncharacterized protein n=1 Tax=Entomophthora muscae TaxID=34485 RepID=A0ACC2RR36_9FUNG|nr:hypothetical protein DSO57_1033198 [Entomophthora muscae]